MKQTQSIAKTLKVRLFDDSDIAVEIKAVTNVREPAESAIVINKPLSKKDWKTKKVVRRNFSVTVHYFSEDFNKKRLGSEFGPRSWKNDTDDKAIVEELNAELMKYIQDWNALPTNNNDQRVAV